MAFAGAETGRPAEQGWAGPLTLECKGSGLPYIPFLVAGEGVRTVGGHTKSGRETQAGLPEWSASICIFRELSWPHILPPVLLPPAAHQLS